MSLRRSLVPAAAWLVLIFATSSIPGSRLPALFPGLDKIIHFLEYAVLTLLLLYAGARHSYLQRILRSPSLLTIATLLLGIALADECYQSTVPGRQPDVLDVGADMLGVWLVLLLLRYWVFNSRSARSQSSRSAPCQPPRSNHK